MVASLGPMPMTTAKHTDTLFRFTDSDYVMDPDTRCSVSGAVFLFAGCPGARGSNPLSPSSTETEYAASTGAGKGANQLEKSIHDLTQDIPQPAPRFLDYQRPAHPSNNIHTKH